MFVNGIIVILGGDSMRAANIAIDIIGFIIMSVLFVNGGLRKGHRSLDNKLFYTLIAVVMAMFVIDGVSWAIYEKVFAGDLIITNIVNTLLYLIGPLVTVLWISYVDYKINDDIKLLHKRLVFYYSPFIINAVLCLIQLFTPVLFTFDVANSNKYIRLPLSWVTYSLPLIYVIVTTIMLVCNKNKIIRKVFFPLAIYMIFPLIGSIIQMMGVGLSTIYIGTAISILIVYITVQNDIDLIDYLTGLQNRRHLMQYLSKKVIHSNNDNLYIIMMDIDNFKGINDIYGHATGDKALIAISEIFTRSAKPRDFVCRYAGDEFIIVTQISSDSEINKVINLIQTNIDSFNLLSDEVFKLSISCGYAKYQKGETVESFLRKADIAMYKEKHRKSEMKVD